MIGNNGMFLNPNVSDIPQNGMVGEWLFNSGNATDTSGNGNDGVVSGATLVNDRHGNANSAYYFNGGSYINLGSDSILKPAHVTVSCWFKPTASVNNLGRIISCDVSGGNAGYKMLRRGFAESLSLSVVTIDSGLSAEVSLDDTTSWRHLVLTYDESTFKGYVDNVLVEEISSTAAIDYTDTTQVCIGARQISYNRLIGSVDDVRIYNRALNASEISQLYNE